MIYCARFAKVRQFGHHGMVGSTLAQWRLCQLDADSWRWRFSPLSPKLFTLGTLVYADFQWFLTCNMLTNQLRTQAVDVLFPEWHIWEQYVRYWDVGTRLLDMIVGLCRHRLSCSSHVWPSYIILFWDSSIKAKPLVVTVILWYPLCFATCDVFDLHRNR